MFTNNDATRPRVLATDPALSVGRVTAHPRRLAHAASYRSLAAYQDTLVAFGGAR